MKITNNNAAREVYSLKENTPKIDQGASKGAAAASSKADSLELSGDAFKFADIKKKISEGYYERPEVLDTIVEKLDILIRENIGPEEELG